MGEVYSSWWVNTVTLTSALFRIVPQYWFCGFRQEGIVHLFPHDWSNLYSLSQDNLQLGWAWACPPNPHSQNHYSSLLLPHILTPLPSESMGHGRHLLFKWLCRHPLSWTYGCTNPIVLNCGSFGTKHSLKAPPISYAYWWTWKTLVYRTCMGQQWSPASSPRVIWPQSPAGFWKKSIKTRGCRRESRDIPGSPVSLRG